MKKGIYLVRVLYVPLFEIGILDAYCKAYFPRIYEYPGNDVISRILAAKRKQKAIAKLLQDYYSDMEDGTFFGIHGVNRREVRIAIENSTDRYKRTLSQGNVVNYAGDFVFMEDDNLQYNGVIELGRGRAVSIEKGRVIANINGKIISPGVDIRGVRDKTDYEREFIQDIIEHVLVRNDLASLYESIKERIDNLLNFNSNNSGRQSLVYGIKYMDKDSISYSVFSLGRERVKVAQAEQLKKGESFRWGYVERDGRVEYVEEEEFLSGRDPVALNYYFNKFFGINRRGGTIGEILFAVFGDDITNLFRQLSIQPPKPKRVPKEQLSLF